MAITSLRDLIATNFNNMLLSPDAELTIQSFTFLDANNQPTGRSYVTPGDVGNITITGNNFTNSTTVVVNNNEVDTLFISNSSLKIATPTLGAGSWPVYVYHGNYVSNLLNLEYGSDVRTWDNFTKTYNIPAGEQVSLDLRFVNTLENDTATYSIVQANTTTPNALTLSSSGILSGNVSVANTGSYSLRLRSQIGTGRTTDVDLTINVFQRTGVPTSFELEPIYRKDSYLYPTYFDRSANSLKKYSGSPSSTAVQYPITKISSNGRKMICGNRGTSTFYLFELLNPWDPSSAVLIHTCPVLFANASLSSYDLCVSDNGLTLYVLTGSNTVNVYSLNSYWDISSINSLIGTFNLVTVTGSGAVTHQSIALSKDNTLLVTATNQASGPWYGVALSATTKLQTGTVYTYSNLGSTSMSLAAIYLEQTDTVTSSTRLYFIKTGYIGYMTNLLSNRSLGGGQPDRVLTLGHRNASPTSMYMTPDGKSFYFGMNGWLDGSGSNTAGGIGYLDARMNTFLSTTTTPANWYSSVYVHVDDLLPGSLFPSTQYVDNKLSVVIQSGTTPNNQCLVVYDDLGIGDSEFKNNVNQGNKETVKIHSVTPLSQDISAVEWANSGYICIVFDNTRKELTFYSTPTPYNFNNAIFIESFVVSIANRVNSIFASNNGKTVYLNAEYDGIYKLTFASYNKLVSFAKINLIINNPTAVLYSHFNFNESGKKLFFVQQNTTSGSQPNTNQTKFVDLATPWDLSSVVGDPYLFSTASARTAVAFNEAKGKAILIDQTVGTRSIHGYSNILNEVNEYYEDVYKLPLIKVSYGDDITFNTATNIWLDETGKRLYIIDAGIFYQMELAEAWNLTTMKFVNKTGTLVTGATGLYISSDGTKLYTVDSTSDQVRQYSFSIPWDINTLVLVRSQSVSAQESVPTDITFKPDGTVMYLVGTNDDSIDRYTLSTPWDISTVSLASTTALLISNPLDVEFNTDGTIMYAVTSGAINTFTLSTAWNTSTAVLSSSKNLAGDNSDTVVAMHISNNGTTLVTVDSTLDKMTRYTMSTPWNIASITFEENYVGYDTSSGVSAYCFANNKQYMFVMDANEGLIKYELTTPGNINTVVFRQKSDTLQFNEDTNIDSIFVNDAGTKLYLFGQVNDSIYEYTFTGDPFDLDTLNFAQSFALSAQTITVSAGIQFNKNGTRYYVLNQTNDTIYQYTTISPWSVISPTMSASLSVTTQDSTPRAMKFNEAGTKLYYYGSTNRRLHIYTLSTPWDISSVTTASSTNPIWVDLAKVDTTHYIGLDIDEQQGYIYMFSNKGKLAKYKMIGF